LSKRNDQVAEWQRKTNFAGFGEKHYLLENSKRDKHRVGSALYSFKYTTGFPAKPSLPARDMMKECVGVGDEEHPSQRE
jgi:hypothetical protein